MDQNMKIDKYIILPKMQSEQEENPYKKYANKQPFHVYTFQNSQLRLPKCYHIRNLIGAGAYGQVYAAIEEDNIETDVKKKLVAIKKISLKKESKVYYKRVLREIKILRNIKSQNIVRLKNIVLPESRQFFNDLYLVFELCDYDLHHVIQNAEKAGLTSEHKQYFAREIINGIRTLHSYGILHRDLKPRNILIKELVPKICDFGLSRYVSPESKDFKLTDYVTTIWYRAPELMLASNDYTEGVDIWSVGCLIGEVLLGKPMFPGKKVKEMWKKIIYFTGLKKEDVLGFSEEQQECIFGMFPDESENHYEEVFESLDGEEALGADLVIRMLKLDPKKRISLEEATRHPYFQKYTFSGLNPVEPINPLQFQFEQTTHELNIEQIKDMIYEQILLYHAPDFADKYCLKIKNNESVFEHIITRYSPNEMQSENSEEDDF